MAKRIPKPAPTTIEQELEFQKALTRKGMRVYAEIAEVGENFGKNDDEEIAEKMPEQVIDELHQELQKKLKGKDPRREKTTEWRHDKVRSWSRFRETDPWVRRFMIDGRYASRFEMKTDLEHKINEAQNEKALDNVDDVVSDVRYEDGITHFVKNGRKMVATDPAAIIKIKGEWVLIDPAAAIYEETETKETVSLEYTGSGNGYKIAKIDGKTVIIPDADAKVIINGVKVQ